MKKVKLTRYAAWKLGCREGDIIDLDGIPHKVKIDKNTSLYGKMRPNPSVFDKTLKRE